MDSPPLPPAPRPLGRTFWILLAAPVASMAVAAGISAISEHKGSGSDSGIMLSLVTLLVMLVCSIVCSVMVGKRRGAGLGVLAFVGILVLYIGVACAGCATVMQGMSFR